MVIFCNLSHMTRAKQLLENTEVNITLHGKPYLGVPIGSVVIIEEFENKVSEWKQELLELTKMSSTQSWLCSQVRLHLQNNSTWAPPSSFTRRGNLDSTPPNLDRQNTTNFIRAWPLCITCTSRRASCYQSFHTLINAILCLSLKVSVLIKQQCADYSVNAMQAHVVAKQEVSREIHRKYNSVAKTLTSSVSDSLTLVMNLAQEKGACMYLDDIATLSRTWLLSAQRSY